MDVSSNGWVLQDTTTTGDGLILKPNRNDQITLYITGTSTSREIYFEGCDAENHWFPIPAVKLPEMTISTYTIGTLNEVWNISGVHWVGIRTRIASISGGTVKITAKVADSNGMNLMNTFGAYIHGDGSVRVRVSDGSTINSIILDSGTVTLGSNDSLTDDSKDYVQDMLAGKTISITKNNITYLREILSNANGTIMFVPIEEPTPATAIVGDGEAPNGQVTITCIGDLVGSVGNDYSIEIVDGDTDTGEVTATLDNDTKILTVYVDSNVLGNPQTLMAGSLATLINNTEGVSDKFSADEINFIPSGIPSTVEPIPFILGDDGISPETGDTYQIKDIEFPMIKGSSTDTKPTDYIRVDKKYLELDTGDIYRYTGAAWVVI